MKHIVALLLLGLSCALAHGQAMKYRVDVKYPEGGERSWDVRTMVGAKSSVQHINTHTVIGEINSNFGEVTQVPAERVSGISASLTAQELMKDGSVLTSLTYTIWSLGQQASKGTHVVQLKHGEKISLPAFEGQTLAITLLK